MLPHSAEKLTEDGVSSVAPGVPLPTLPVSMPTGSLSPL